MLLGQHLDSMEIARQPGAGQLVGLLQRVALGDQYELVPSEQVGDGVRNTWQQLYFPVGNRSHEETDFLMILFADLATGQLLETTDQRALKILQTVAMGFDGFTFDLIEMAAHFFRCMGVVVEMRDEIGDRPFKMDVVFPQRVISIHEQGLRLEKANRLARSTHQLIIERPYFMSRQLGPTPQSTRTGTLSWITDSISWRTNAFTCSTSLSGTSKSNSS